MKKNSLHNIDYQPHQYRIKRHASAFFDYAAFNHKEFDTQQSKIQITNQHAKDTYHELSTEQHSNIDILQDIGFEETRAVFELITHQQNKIKSRSKNIHKLDAKPPIKLLPKSTISETAQYPSSQFNRALNKQIEDIFNCEKWRNRSKAGKDRREKENVSQNKPRPVVKVALNIKRLQK